MSGTRDPSRDSAEPGSELRALYRAGASEEPPPEVDDRIRAAAHRAVQARPASAPPRRLWRPRLPLAAAAVLVLSATVTVLITKHEHDARSRVPMPTAAPSAGPAPSAADVEMGRAEPSKELRKSAGPTSDARAVAKPQATGPGLNAPPLSPDSALLRESGSDTALEPPPREPHQAQPLPGPDKDASAAKVMRAEPRPSAAAEGAAATGSANLAPDAQSVPAASPPARAKSEAESRTLQEAPAVPLPATAPLELEKASPGAMGDSSAPAGDAERRFDGEQAAQAESAPGMEAVPADAGAAAAVPAGEWIERIRKLMREGRSAEAGESLAAFRRAYPAYPLPADLR